MAFFDDLTQKVNKFGQDVTQKTQSLTGSVKLNSQIGDARKNLAVMYEQLGRMVIQDKAVLENAQYRQQVEMIQGAENNIRNLEEQLAITKGEVKCKNCGMYVPQGNAYCQNCGTKIDPPTPQQNFQQQWQNPQGMNNGMNPQGMNNGMNPQGMNNGMNPQGMNNGMNPQGMNNGMNPQGMNNGMNPQGMNNGMNPQQNGYGTAPVSDGSQER